MSDFSFCDFITHHTPTLMGVLNITPDSFSDGGMNNSKQTIHNHIHDLWQQGTDIIDIGAESTRPNAVKIDVSTEIDRLSILDFPLVKQSPKHIYSIDTYKSQTAEFALKNGFDIVNDVTGLHHDTDMAKIISDYQAGVVIMYNHSLNPHKTGDIVHDCMVGLQKSLEIAYRANIDMKKICLDIGIGFGTSPQQSISLVNNIAKIKTYGLPILVGASRKSFIHHFLNIPEPQKRLGATLATHYTAVKNGADIIRIHDVFDHKQFFDMMPILHTPPLEYEALNAG